MRFVLVVIAFGCAPLAAFAAAPFVRLSADQATYSVGSSATLSAVSMVQPGPGDEIYIGATFNGAPVAVSQAGTGIGVFHTGALPRGPSVFTVQLYLEDRIFGDQLTSSIDAWNLENAQLSTQIGQATDPTQLARLQAQYQQNLLLIQEAQQELVLLRRAFGTSQTLSIYAN